MHVVSIGESRHRTCLRVWQAHTPQPSPRTPAHTCLAACRNGRAASPFVVPSPHALHVCGGGVQILGPRWSDDKVVTAHDPILTRDSLLVQVAALWHSVCAHTRHLLRELRRDSRNTTHAACWTRCQAACSHRGTTCACNASIPRPSRTVSAPQDRHTERKAQAWAHDPS